MQIALNGDDKYQGGHLVFASPKGILVPKRPAGSATIHTSGVVHAVSNMRSGVRYGLFFCDTKGHHQPSMKKEDVYTTTVTGLETLLVPAALENFQFYEKALQFLSQTSDDDLYKHQEQYLECFQLHNMDGISDSNKKTILFPSFACELFAHVHMLHPQVYSSVFNQTSTCTTVAKLGVDLVVACRKQAVFMKNILELKGKADNESFMTKVVTEYGVFLHSLGGARSTNERAVPCLLVDHIWHTHMCFPRQYARDCLRICGCSLDHLIISLIV